MTSVGLLDGQVYMLQRNQKVYRADAEDATPGVLIPRSRVRPSGRT